ncbi:hypothetical protein [Pseudogemmobacter faecipullorum]|uniref:Tip attachment protein J domain-containing protein n=1 Tax=Pseudogemmobacter faecipullorum TaxID=2755041 RepID=A0ABS8CPM2_9RHOB|nr:hypothetical protein [Pseudogemmobacter faecipullorum]MCB5411324.1 hypothetical protein [Pseudogemmobacter faecipullorum]
MILAVYRDTFSFSPQVVRLPEGETLQVMRSRMPSLPDEFDEYGVICINGHPVPRDLWGMLRPKPQAVTEITFHLPAQGGGGDGKNIFATIASIALTVVSGGIAGGTLLGGLTGASVAGGATVASLALAAGVSLAGSLLISALVPPPSIETAKGRAVQNPGAASADGNLLEPNGPIPRVVGERKVYPPLAAEPFTYFSGPDEVVEAAYILAGPHRIRDIRLGAASVSGVPDIDFEVREGWPGEIPIGLIRRQSRTEPLQAELRGHIVSDEDGRTISTVTGDTATAAPQVQIVATRDAPDEHQLQVIFSQGLHRNGSETALLRVPLRLRLRAIGGSWVSLPELHFQGATLRQLRATIRLVWTKDAAATPSASGSEGWVEARKAAPGQAVAPASQAFAADPYFGTSGPDYMDAANLEATGVQHVELDRYTATILLDEAVFPRGRYEIEAQRGASFLAANYSPAAYTCSGTVWNFWGWQGTPGIIVMSRDQVLDTLYILRSVSIWNEPPLPSRDLAVIAVRARNRAVDRASCVAGGWVRDWDGTGWNDWKVTDNPAPHLRDIWAGSENLDAVPQDLIDDQALAQWRLHCISKGYTCNALIEDQSIDDAARIVASCGYAKPIMSDIWSVSVDRDRSSEAPVQLFTPRNMRNFQYTKAFARVPEGFRVNFRDASRDYDAHQISVFRPGSSDDSGRMEQITLEGIVHEADAIKRAEYDQNQAQLRSTFYSWEAAAESILCRRGDLIAVQHDMLTEWSGAGRIVAIITNSAGDIVEIQLDTPVEVAEYPFLDQVPNLAEEPNLALLGRRSGVAIRHGGSVAVHPASGGSGSSVEFSPPIDPDDIGIGDLVAVGAIGKETLRLMVFGVTPRPNFEATITAVDEAPELWQ